MSTLIGVWICTRTGVQRQCVCTSVREERVCPGRTHKDLKQLVSPPPTNEVGTQCVRMSPPTVICSCEDRKHQDPRPRAWPHPRSLGKDLKGRPVGGHNGEKTGRQKLRNELGLFCLLSCFDFPCSITACYIPCSNYVSPALHEDGDFLRFVCCCV